MFDPTTIKRGREIAPRKVVIYGPPKQGKSTLAACAPDALLIPTEDRVKHIDVAKTDVCRSFEEVMSVFEYLMETTPYKTVIVDTIDWLEPLLHEYVCKKKGFTSFFLWSCKVNISYLLSKLTNSSSIFSSFVWKSYHKV